MKILQIKWHDLPHLDQAWYNAQCKRIKIEEDIASELDVSYTGSARGVVFREFKEAHILYSEYEVDPNQPVIRTFDYGKTCACVFSQKDVLGNIVFFHEIVFENIENPTQTLGRAVLNYSDDLRHSGGFRDFDDPAGTNDNYVNSEETSFKVLARMGLHPTHMVSGADSKRKRNRIELMKYKLATWENGKPVVMFHHSMKTTIEALRTGYRYKQDKNTKEILDEVDEIHPFEDVMDVVGMTLMEAFPVNSVDHGRRSGESGFQKRRNRYTGY